MAKFVIAVALVACIAYVTDAAIVKRETCPGCATEQDKAHFSEVLPKLKAALATTNADISVVEIISYKTQVVSGSKHIVEYKDKDSHICTASWVDQPWIKPVMPRYVQNKCA